MGELHSVRIFLMGVMGWPLLQSRLLFLTICLTEFLKDVVLPLWWNPFWSHGYVDDSITAVGSDQIKNRSERSQRTKRSHPVYRTDRRKPLTYHRLQKTNAHWQTKAMSTHIRKFFFAQIFFCGYENFRVHTQRIQMVWYPIVSGNEHAHNCDFGVISSAP